MSTLWNVVSSYCLRRAGRGGWKKRTPSCNGTLRHEVARLIVWHAVSTRPVVPSTVSYVVRQQGNALSNAHGHRTHRHPTGTRTARRRCWMDGRVNIRELSCAVTVSNTLLVTRIGFGGYPRGQPPYLMPKG